MMLYLSFLSPCPIPPALPCLLASISPPPAGSWEEQAAMMIAWRVSSPACLPVVNFPMPPHRCRLVGRFVERAVFALGSVMAICPRARPVASSRWYGSCPWRLASMNCPHRVSCLLSIISRLVWRLVSLVSAIVSLCLPCPRCVFLVFFSVNSPASCPRLICPRARLVQSSRHLVSSCVS